MSQLQKVLDSEMVLHLSHNDLDGYGSSYVVYQYMMKVRDFKNTEQLFIQENEDYGKILDVINSWRDTYCQGYDCGLLITDLNVNPKEIEAIKSIFGDKWYVIDHHTNGDMKILEYPDNCFIDKNSCATLLTFDVLRHLDRPEVSDDDPRNFDNRELNLFTSTVNVYDLYLRDSFFDFNLGTWFTKCIKQCPVVNKTLKKNYLYNLFTTFHSSGAVKQPQIEKRLVDFQYEFIKNTWKDHNELASVLEQIYPDLQLVTDKSSIMTYLELIPINVLFAYLEFLVIGTYIKYEDPNITIFEGINSDVLTRVYDILFTKEEYRQRVLINVTSKYKDLTTFGFRSKNGKSGQTAAAISKIGGPDAAGGGHNDAAGGSVKRNMDVFDYTELLCNAFNYGEREAHNESRP